jgi:hypothetical protein
MNESPAATAVAIRVLARTPIRLPHVHLAVVLPQDGKLYAVDGDEFFLGQVESEGAATA